MNVLSDAWHHRALGKSGETVWKCLLANGALKTKEIAEQTGRHVNTVRNALNKLWMYGLAAPDGGGLWVAEPAGIDYLQEVAEELGTKGAAEKRRVKHEQERAIWASQQMLRQKEQWERRHERGELTADGQCALCRSRQSRK
jgi:hypothetical protein